MTETSAVIRLVKEARHKLQPAIAPRDPRLHIDIARPTAKVLLKRPYRDAEYVRRHVDYVVDMSADEGEAHIIRNLQCIRRNLEELGIDRKVIEQEVRSIEGAVRSELWRRILLPGGDR
jgi:hypothetical protein